MMEQFVYITQKLSDPYRLQNKKTIFNILATEFQHIHCVLLRLQTTTKQVLIYSVPQR